MTSVLKKRLVKKKATSAFTEQLRFVPFILHIKRNVQFIFPVSKKTFSLLWVFLGSKPGHGLEKRMQRTIKKCFKSLEEKLFFRLVLTCWSVLHNFTRRTLVRKDLFYWSLNGLEREPNLNNKIVILLIFVWEYHLQRINFCQIAST